MVSVVEKNTEQSTRKNTHNAVITLVSGEVLNINFMHSFMDYYDDDRFFRLYTAEGITEVINKSEIERFTLTSLK